MIRTLSADDQQPARTFFRMSELVASLSTATSPLGGVQCEPGTRNRVENVASAWESSVVSGT
jgi:hypothetical protein